MSQYIIIALGACLSFIGTYYLVGTVQTYYIVLQAWGIGCLTGILINMCLTILRNK